MRTRARLAFIPGKMVSLQTPFAPMPQLLSRFWFSLRFAGLAVAVLLVLGLNQRAVSVLRPTGKSPAVLAPNPNAAQRVALTPMAPTPAATQAAQPAPPSPTIAHPSAVGAAQVQLAAVGSEQAAQAEWQRLSKKYPELLASRHLAMSHVDRDGKTFWRVRTGGFADAASATSFCTQIKAKGAACSVASF